MRLKYDDVDGEDGAPPTMPVEVVKAAFMTPKWFINGDAKDGVVPAANVTTLAPVSADF